MDDIDFMYQEILLDHSKIPRNRRLVEDADFKEEAFNPLCGDKVLITGKLSPPPDSTLDIIGVIAEGCAISVASGSLMSELMQGVALCHVETILQAITSFCKGEQSPEEIDAHLHMLPPAARHNLQALGGVSRFPMRVKCATMAWHGLYKGVVSCQ